MNGEEELTDEAQPVSGTDGGGRKLFAISNARGRDHRFTLLSQMRSNLQRWERRVLEMKGCKTATELLRQYGEPGHKVPEDGFEIWHYPLGAESGMLYSVHVAVSSDQPSQIYIHMEPTELGFTKS